MKGFEIVSPVPDSLLLTPKEKRKPLHGQLSSLLIEGPKAEKES